MTRRRLVAGLLLLVLVAVAVPGLLTWPLRHVESDAQAARTDLSAAKDSLLSGDVAGARAHVEAARRHVQDAHDAAYGVGGDVWRRMPVVGGAVRDVRHLVSALDHATSVAEIGVSAYPTLTGGDGLLEGGNVDLPALERLLASASEAATQAHAASNELDQVRGDSPVVGDRIAAARDEALAALEPLEARYDRLKPLVEGLPDALGADGERRYLLAVLNPAELRYSGGATLSLARLSVDHGRTSLAEPVTVSDAVEGQPRLHWAAVPDNPFHAPSPNRLTNATFNPNWSTSGPELLRAWRASSGERYDGLIVIDLPGLAALFDLTGPIQVPGYGALASDNLVKVLAGSYDRYDDTDERKRFNAALIPAFYHALVRSEASLEEVSALSAAAQARHFALYFKDPALEEAFESSGFDGDLGDNSHDYLGVFTQNLNGSKVDFYQRRSVTSDVTVHEDGSATVDVTVGLDNPTPPYTRVDPDPKEGYFTRWNSSTVGFFLPRGAKLGPVSIDGRRVEPFRHDAAGLSWFTRNITLAPNARLVVTYSYTAPAAAVVSDGGLDYKLTVDPQGLVNPEALDVAVRFPAGYAVDVLPTGWVADGPSYVWRSEALDTSHEWTLSARN